MYKYIRPNAHEIKNILETVSRWNAPQVITNKKLEESNHKNENTRTYGEQWRFRRIGRLWIS